MSTENEEQYVSERYEALKDSYNTILLRLDPTPTLEEIRRFLLRQTRFNNESQSYYRPKTQQPMFDEEGVDELMLELRARMSIDKVLSKLEENNIRLIIREVGEVILEFIWFKANKYNINESDYTSIFTAIKQNIEIFLRRAKGGTENELLSRVFTSREVINRMGESVDRTQEPKVNMNPFSKGGRY